MRTSKNIILFIFFIGMIFTIVQYLPFIEDLNLKTEISKKNNSNEDDNEGDSEGDNDFDNESLEFINSNNKFHLGNFSIGFIRSYHSEFNYKCSLSNITTPPPEAI